MGVEHGFLVLEYTARDPAFEGEGDVLFNADGTELWAAHGVRTCCSSHRHVADAWHVPVHSLHLVDPRFYHLGYVLCRRWSADIADRTIPKHSTRLRWRRLKRHFRRTSGWR